MFCCRGRSTQQQHLRGVVDNKQNLFMDIVLSTAMAGPSSAPLHQGFKRNQK